MQRAILYTRVSTGKQAEEGTSLEVQEELCLRKAQQEKAQVVDILSDEGVSGALYLSRPGIQEALKRIEAGEANLLITLKLDRSGRDVDVLRLIRKRVMNAGGRLLFADGMNFENNAIGNLMFTQIAGYAEYEKEIIRERTMSGRRRRAEEGQQPSRAMSPYGYHVVTKKDVIAGLYPANLLGTYQIIEAQAVIVRRIFQEYAGGASLTQLCRRLQAESIPTPRDGQYWRRCTVQRILNNPVYKGTPVSGRHAARTDERRAETGRKVTYIVKVDEAQWIYLEAPALVDDATFSLCQVKLREGNRSKSGNPDRIHLLSSLIRCPLCGKAMAGKWVKRTYKDQKTVFDPYYHCQNAYPSSNPGGVVCNNQNYRALDMERLTCQAVQFLATQPDILEKALRALAHQRARQQQSGTGTALKAALRELEAREKATIEAQIVGIMSGASASAYAQVLQEIARQRDEVQARLLEMQPQNGTAPNEGEAARQITTMVIDVEEALTAEELTPAERRQLLSRVVREVKPKRDEKGEWGVLVTLRSPFAQPGMETLHQTVSMISMLARGTVTVRPSSSFASSTRTQVSDST
jgi:site-specific DNA recombinase